MKTPSPVKFIGSFSYDVRLAPYDIAGSIAHATMLSRCGIIPRQDGARIVKGLKAILMDLHRGWALPAEEDIHYAIEAELIRRVGDAGRRLHTGRSRNDQVVTALFLYLKDNAGAIVGGLRKLQASVVTVAERYRDAVMPGFTHLQHGQPILFAHHLLAYGWMFQRDRERFEGVLQRLDVSPLGSAALAGTSFPIDRSMTARLLKFGRVSENSIDATASRDVPIEFTGACAILMSNLSRLAEELIVWSSAEFDFISIAEEFTSGSSIMPQKRNPDVAEIVRGETGRVYGALIALLTIVKGLPLAYNRDLQEDKPPVFDAVDTVVGCLSVMAPMVGSMRVKTANLKRWCDYGYLAATELADFLARKGVPFRTAHGVVRNLVAYCEEKGARFEQISLLDLKRFHTAFDREALSLLTPEKVVRAKRSYGGTSPDSVRRQIRSLRRLFR